MRVLSKQLWLDLRKFELCSKLLLFKKWNVRNCYMNYQNAIKRPSIYTLFSLYMTRFSKCATKKCVAMLIGLNFVIASPLLAETQVKRFLVNQATVSYTTAEQAFVIRSNESRVPIVSPVELSRKIALRYLKFNGLSPEIVSLLLLEAKPQRFLVNQATVSYEKLGKEIIATSNESVVGVGSAPDIKLTSRSSYKPEAKPEALTEIVRPRL